MMFQKSYKLVSLFLAFAFLVAAAFPALTSAAPKQNIVEIAASNPDFSTLVAAVQKAGLVDALDGPKRYTVFAPTNAAFDHLAADLGYASGEALVHALTAEQLTPILLYHVTNGNRAARTLFPPQKVRMISKSFAETTIVGGEKFIDGQKIIAQNIRASNGFIHVIDGVMLP
jgi:transforming growth factor-beta-induced protein